MYSVIFISKDKQLNSKYDYHELPDARHHFDLFRNDDSNLYRSISIYDSDSNLIIDILLFDNKGKIIQEFKDGAIVKYTTEWCYPSEANLRFVITNIHEDTERCLIKCLNCGNAIGYSENVSLYMIEPVTSGF